MNDLKININREVWGSRLSVRIGACINESNGFAIAQPLQFIANPSPECESPASFYLTLNDAQLFMDELWHVGIRPTEGTGSAGAMAATQAHLKDMQRLVFEQHLISTKPSLSNNNLLKKT